MTALFPLKTGFDLEQQKGRGRPTKWRPEYAGQAKVACRLGATDKDLAELFGVCEQTINVWKESQPEFLESLKAKELSDSLVEQALYKRALGAKVKEQKPVNIDGVVSYEEVEKEYPPDTGACVVWLANRQPKRWKKDPKGDEEQESKEITINIVNPHADPAD